MIETILLAAGEMACAIAPGLGGAILSLRHGGRDVLRSCDRAQDVLDAACFPLVPFANRIAYGRLHFADEAARLAIDPEGSPHALHGHGWRRAWMVGEVGPAHAVLNMDSNNERGWPWHYSATQRLALTGDALTLELAITSHEPKRAMPAGLGIHPYFDRPGPVWLTARAGSTWRNDPTGLACEEVASARFAGSPVALDGCEGLDNFFSSPDPRILIERADMIVALEGEGAGFHLYCPPGQPWFCVEPVSHAPNSFGRSQFGRDDILPPLATRRQTYRISVLPPVQGQEQ